MLKTAVELGYFAASCTPNQEAALAIGPAVTTPLLVFGGIYGSNRLGLDSPTSLNYLTIITFCYS